MQQRRRFAGRFDLLRLLGSGASGSVHLAHDRQGRRLVALKTLHSTSIASADDGAARLLASAAHAAQLEHPDIVRIFDGGSHEGQPWVAMQAVPGCDLSRYTLALRLLPEPVVLQLGARLALALTHAHARGVVHRDLKPSNVLVHWPSRGLKIVDFGLARGQDAEATRTGLILGTPGYMAPEQLAGAVPDSRSDFYALGVLLFQLLTGRLPFQAQSMGELLRQVAQDTAPDLRSLRPDWPAAVAAPLADAVAALLQAQAVQRSCDGGALAAKLHALQDEWRAAAA